MIFVFIGTASTSNFILGNKIFEENNYLSWMKIYEILPKSHAELMN